MLNWYNFSIAVFVVDCMKILKKIEKEIMDINKQHAMDMTERCKRETA